MPLLIKLGICELAVGVLSGWAMIAMVERPEALKRFGVRQLARMPYETPASCCIRRPRL